MFNTAIPSTMTVVPCDVFEIQISAGEQGPPGSQELKVKEVASIDQTVIDYAQGAWQHLTLTGDVTSLSVINWPAAGKAARLVLQITNNGAFNINGWPAGTLWPSGDPPQITGREGAQDIIVLSTGSGGAPIFGSVVGQDFA